MEVDLEEIKQEKEKLQKRTKTLIDAIQCHLTAMENQLIEENYIQTEKQLGEIITSCIWLQDAYMRLYELYILFSPNIEED